MKSQKIEGKIQGLKAELKESGRDQLPCPPMAPEKAPIDARRKKSDPEESVGVTYKDEIVQCEIKTPQLREAQKKLSSCQMELESALSTIEELQNYKMSKQQDEKEFRGCLETCEKQVTLKNNDAQRKRANGDKDGAKEAEISAITYNFWSVNALMGLERWSQAEQLVRFVWEKRKSFLGKEDSQTRSAQQKLCSALREHKSQDKLQEAEMIYYNIWRHKDAATKIKSGDVLVLGSGHKLALVYEEQGSLPRSDMQHREVWETLIKTLGPTHDDTLQSAVHLVSFLERQKRVQDAIHVLQAIWEVRGTKISARMLTCVKKLGRHLYDTNQNAKRSLFLTLLGTRPRENVTTRKAPITSPWHTVSARFFTARTNVRSTKKPGPSLTSCGQQRIKHQRLFPTNSTSARGMPGHSDK